MDEYALSFLPFLKKQPALEIEDSEPGQLTAVLDLRVVDGQDNEHPVGSRVLVLRGPGDILGISPNMIARLEPPPQAHDFEPNYFPFIEFVDPDLPWRYSLEKVEATSHRVRPWLSLIVLSAAEMDEMAADNIEVISVLEDRRQFLTVWGRYLPNLEDAWTTSHVHLSHLQGSIEAFIENNPAGHCSRLFCFRRLAPETNYMAFLVPNYKIAVQAAFGLGQDGVGSEKAWADLAAEDIIRLPVYYHWSFATSESGDFEQLARNLKPTAVDASRVGTKAVDANLMSPLAEAQFDRYFLREGALAAPRFASDRQPYCKHSYPLPLTGSLLNFLNESLKSPEKTLAEEADDDVDPLITLPVYGRYFRYTDEIKIPENEHWPTPTPWIHELNLDFRHRVSASFGTTVVQQHQDDYMKACWSQVGEIRKENEKRRLFQAAYVVSKAIENKHIKPLSDARFALISSPFHAYVAASDQGESVSLKQELADSGISQGVFSSTFRRAVHRQIGIEQVKPDSPIGQAKAGFHARPLQLRRPTLPPAPKVLDAVLKPLPGAETTTAVPMVASKKEVIAVKEIDFSTGFRRKFDVGKALREKLSGMIAYNDGRVITEDFEPNMAHPEIDIPMYAPLRNLSNDYILPGIEYIENNGVTLCEENRRFIEAYMVGINHEMGRELVWRSFPTDQRGTIFSYFWDQVTAKDPPPDIKDIHKWTRELGDNRNAGSQDANLVLVIKGDLIRRYPGTIVYAIWIEGKGNYWAEDFPENDPPMTGEYRIDPVLRARVGSDILCVGFPFSLQDVRGDFRDGEYYFILQENQDLPRFGLDVASERINEAPGCEPQDVDINELSWFDVTLDDASYITEFESAPFIDDDWPIATSATIARRTYQLPMRVAIHASELLPAGVST